MHDQSARRRSHSAVESALFSGRFGAVATEMGELLRRMSFSTNVKERLDFSCALLDPLGRLLVNAPHIPVHLGALGLCVRSVVERLPLVAGDVVITNHPGFGGSHLPDVTVFGPIHHKGTLIGYAASRAHHAEFGGLRPGSMPPSATNLEQEGVVLEPIKMVEAGEARWDRVERRLRGAKYPSRSPEENLADLSGALAAHRRAETMLQLLCARYGARDLAQQMQAVYDNAAEQMREALETLGSRRVSAEERLDDGTKINVAIQIEDGGAVVDFSGSGPTLNNNFNATPAIVRSAVLYCFRLLLDRDLPLNEGLLHTVELRVPEGTFLNPVFADDPIDCPAVVAGNVETSQRVVDTVLKALGILSGGQGTMNNLVFGNERFGYYETICGGAGAGPGFAGASAVHTHMTNTRITDPEILEIRYPVRLHEFSIRRGSGGNGHTRGGDGARRILEMTEAVEVSFLSQHRVEAPFALEGAEPGEMGRQWVERGDGVVEQLAGVSSVEMQPGDRFVVETPSGAGYGAPSD